ncbi:MAG TPA: beta-N-acetylhexosaminidase, partial [Pyrinomonadaceae bacterium]|nr:beta-N-acetylhexosaminidase [Pyrinomonadaceae bacterium]
MRITVTRSEIHRVLIIAACIFLCASVKAQSNKLQVIPAPKQMTAGEGSFQLRDARVVIADAKSADDQFAAQDFIDDVKATANASMSIARSARKKITIGRVDSLPIAQALRRMNAAVPASLGEEGYVLLANADEVIVAGNTAAGTFYGLETLKQLVRGDGANAFIPTVKIVDWPTMRWRGVSDDISRGPVPTLDYIKRQIRTEACFKMNMHSFYMEHTFSSQSHPLIGPEGGSLTPAEIKELVAYARSYHVELVP